MDVPLVSSLPVSAATSVSPIAAAQALAIAEAQNAAALSASFTTVDLSPLGRFLSATSLFQKKVLELQIAAGNADDAKVAASDPAVIAASAVSLAGAFNELRANNIGATDVDTGSADGQSLAALFAQQFGGETVPADDSATLASFEAIGLNFVPAPADAQGEVLSIDQPVLEAAFVNDPAATTTLLGQAANAFTTLAGVAPPDEPAPASAAVQPSPEVLQAASAQAQQAVAAAAPAREDAFLQELINETAAPPAAAPAPAAEVFRSEAQFLTLPEIAPASPAVASAAPAAAVASPAAAAADNPLAIDPAVEAQVNRALAEQAQAARSATVATDDKVQRASDAERSALAAANDRHDAAMADAIRIDNKAAQVRREQQAAAAAPDSGPVPLEETARTATLVAQPVAQANDTADTVATPAQQAQPDRAQQAARDPAIAAAIAAYNLNTGPFAALNGRPEAGAPKVKIVPPVATVSKVAPVDTESNLHGGAREFR